MSTYPRSSVQLYLSITTLFAYAGLDHFEPIDTTNDYQFKKKTFCGLVLKKNDSPRLLAIRNSCVTAMILYSYIRNSHLYRA